MTHLIHDIAVAGAACAVERLDDLLPRDPAAREAAAERLYEIIVGGVEAFVLRANLLQRAAAAREN